MVMDVSKLRRGALEPKWRMLNALPNASAAGTFMRALRIPALNIDWVAVIASASVLYTYDVGADACVPLPSTGMAGTFGAGACGRIHPMGDTVAGSNSNTTTTIVTALTLTRDLRGFYIRCTGGTGLCAGEVRRIKSNTQVSGASVITVDTPFSSTPSLTAANTFVLLVPRLWMYNPSSSTSGFAVYSYATNTWTQKTVTGGMTTGGTDVALCQTPAMVGNGLDSHDGKVFVSGTGTALTLTADIGGPAWAVDEWKGGILTVTGGLGAGQVRTVASNTALTLTFDVALATAFDATTTWILERPFESSRNKGTIVYTNTTNATITRADGGLWTVNSWANSQVRIIGGTGAGQVLNVTSNTTTALTLTGVWPIALDATSIWSIEGNDNNMYLLGNAAVTMYKYSISANTWAGATATSARAASPNVGVGATWVYNVRDPEWTATTKIRNGRYIYSFRGNSSALDVYDLALTTWATIFGVNGVQNYGNQTEYMTTGYSYEYDDRDNIYIASARSAFYRLDLVRNAIYPSSGYQVPQGTAVVGDKLFLWPFMSDGRRIDVLYHWRNSDTTLHKVLMWSTYGS